MAENISLKIFTPEKVVLNKSVHRVVLPYGKTNLTIIDERAPTSLLLNQGPMKILDENDNTKEVYFIDGGVVDVAKNVCKISTLRLIKESEINEEKALELAESDAQNAKFYQMIADYIKAFG